MISIVVPAYNRSATIRASVESVLRQTYSTFELLVVDDASTDDTVEQVEAIGDARIRVVRHSQNRGVSAARNTGIREARGIWVAFQDSDDEWLPRKLEKQMAELEASTPDTVGVYCGMVVVGRHFQGKGDRRQVLYIPNARLTTVAGQIMTTLLAANLASTQTLIVRREKLLEVGGFDEDLPALVDWDCMLRLARLGPFRFVDEPLVLQFFSENSITRSVAMRVAARRMIIAKHQDVFEMEPMILARQFESIAGEERLLGNLAAARQAIREALRRSPGSLRLWGKLLIMTAEDAFGRTRNRRAN